MESYIQQATLDIILNKAKIIIALWARQTGKTTSIINIAFRYANEGKKVKIIANSAASAKHIKSFFIGKEENIRVSSDIESLRGMNYDIYLFDEFMFSDVNDYNVVAPLLMRNKSKLVFISTFNKEKLHLLENLQKITNGYNRILHEVVYKKDGIFNYATLSNCVYHDNYDLREMKGDEYFTGFPPALS